MDGIRNVGHPGVLFHWWRSPGGRAAHPLSDDARMCLESAFEPVGARTPLLAVEQTKLYGSTHTWQLAVCARLPASAYYRLQLRRVDIMYRPAT